MNDPARSGQSFLKSFKALPHPPGRDAQPLAPTSAPAQAPTAYRPTEYGMDIVISTQYSPELYTFNPNSETLPSTRFGLTVDPSLDSVVFAKI